jgi:hypothetical protein
MNTEQWAAVALGCVTLATQLVVRLWPNPKRCSRTVRVRTPRHATPSKSRAARPHARAARQGHRARVAHAGPPPLTLTMGGGSRVPRPSVPPPRNNGVPPGGHLASFGNTSRALFDGCCPKCSRVVRLRPH